MVPNGWEETRLKHIARIKSGSTPLRAKQDLYYSQDGTPWVKTLDLNNAEIFETDERITELALKETSCSIFPVNTVLVAMYGGFNQIGRTGLLTVPSAINQALSGLMLDDTKADSKYILNYLNGNILQWKKFAASSRKDPNITREDVCNFEVLLPPLPEQRKIAKILSTWDKAIATTERLIDAGKRQKKALMQQLLTGKKRLVDPEMGKTFEGDWEEVRLSQLVKVTGGNAFKSEQFATQGIPLIKISNIKADYSVNVDSSVFIVEESKYEKFKVKTGDVLIAMSGATTGKVGCYRFNDFSYLNQRVGRFDPKKNKIIKPYLFQLLKLPKVQHDILIDAVGGAQPNISNKDIERLKVKVPAIGEQQKIASVLTAADKEIELLEAKLAHLKEEKKALMQQLLTGKRRVKVEHTEAA
ncbi:restriction endonuclease subunit S [Vibrio vulnificus]|uniref:Restriction endonuclease subunit S n=1 Tax=Vibrio vulnificus TaxID=672 RepID=A0A8H9N2X2_VIBVL|nr:restriction endonuclease subunit S [Vibrio vulnificus]ELI0350200.1 restriction endonuclease subunit S [Vibrio vulnificus]MCU8224503.1 restriction endonuclease subunit S [Vibrio vulnificus]MDK2639417.1 restriction endonuclease subunit S [Vibrio vulnificus]MDK2648285.1 restriction endonuclease subunit S [Vibrio vulnificus]MDK2665875.1 restriction endonuclease subunit S [Vibrio vulnificus]